MSAVDQKKEFAGGNEKLISYINSRLKDVGCESAKLKRVALLFVIEKDGSQSDIKVLDSPNDATKDAVIKILTSLPKLISGKYNYKDVRVMYSVLLKEQKKMPTIKAVRSKLD